jgi:hypothetical protein
MNMHVRLCLGILSCLVIHGQAAEIGPLLPSNNSPPPEEEYVDPDYPPLEPFETAFDGANVIPQRPELLKHYESMLEQFPDHPRLPEVMVQLAVVSGYYNPTIGEKRNTAAMLSRRSLAATPKTSQNHLIHWLSSASLPPKINLFGTNLYEQSLMPEICSPPWSIIRCCSGDTKSWYFLSVAEGQSRSLSIEARH